MSDVPLGQLAPFAVPAPPAEPAAAGGPPAGSWERTRRVYAGPGWVGGRLRQVESRRGRAGYLLRIENAGEFAVRADGSEIILRRPAGWRGPGEPPPAAVLGPCLILALALRGVWCLHAGAAGPEGRAVALAGDSGCGKSTLTAALAVAGSGWRRVADDLLPMRLGDSGAWALPRFPQPHLGPESQWRPPAPVELELAAIYLLEPGGEALEAQRLRGRRAALALVAQTVAARLFDAELQARHLGFCVELARRVAVYRLRFRRRLAELPATTAAIVAALDG